MTNDVNKRCPYYKAESQNVKSRWICVIPNRDRKWPFRKPIPHTKTACEVIIFLMPPKSDPIRTGSVFHSIFLETL